ncbi:hypothetical protein [Azonexus sp.]|jgi:hypothetical protein|uniref:hypothetical protein n=1 Tax=Azonexus sp. TaxID=1872668 RepID=UPI00282B691A|nr:hypothetical protein [Azonexus sp.]MDR1995330.1 hypothetical protein [Azonexus sp.]
MNTLAAYGLLAHALIFGAAAALLPLGELRPRAALVATAVALLGGIAPAMHSLFGTPSLTLLQLAILQLTNRMPSPFGYRPALILLAFAALFYPAALGWGASDPYALGYQPWALLTALAPLAVALWWRRLDAWLLILAVDLAGYAGGLFVNLWDALFDPLLVLLAALIVGRRLLLRLIASRLR